MCQEIDPLITFTDADFAGVDPKQDDPMVITVGIANWDVRKVLVDRGSLSDIIFLSTFQRLDISLKLIKLRLELLIGFTVEQVHTYGAVELETTFGMGELSTNVLTVERFRHDHLDDASHDEVPQSERRHHHY